MKNETNKQVELQLDLLFKNVGEINDTLKQIRTILQKATGFKR